MRKNNQDFGLSRVLRSTGALEIAWRQQFYTWGQDILCESGNLLTRFGFQKLPRAEGAHFSEYIWCGLVNLGTSYREDLRALHVHLWAFGLCITLDRQEALFYSRSSLRPWYISALPKRLPHSHDGWTQYLKECGCERCLESHHSDFFQTLRQALFVWVRDYEIWVSNLLGDEFRDRATCVRKDFIVAPSDLRRLWNSYAYQPSILA